MHCPWLFVSQGHFLWIMDGSCSHVLPTFHMGQEHNIVDTSPPATRPSWALVLVLAFQHVIVLFSGIILIPVMLVNIYNLDMGNAHYLIFATAMCAAASTLLQLIKGKRFGLGSPMFMGTSGAFMSCAHSAMALGGTSLLAGMILVSAPFQVLFSYLIRYMRHILTPTVGGVIIMLAVVGLLKDSVLTWGNAGHEVGEAALMDIGTGMVTIVIMLGVEWFGGRKLRPWALPFGIMAGSLVAAVAGLPVVAGLENAAWIGLPKGEWPGFTFAFGSMEHWVLTLTFVMAVLATSVKYAGDAMILQKVAAPERKKVDYDALQGGLYANSAGMILSGLMGGMPSSSHSANIPLMEMTGVATRRLAAVSALLLAAISLSPKMLLLLINIPQPVIGGVGVVLVAHLFSAGMQLMVADINHRNGLIAGLSLCTGLTAVSGDFFPQAFPLFLDPLLHNGVALGGLVAVFLTLITHLGTHRALTLKMVPSLESLGGFKEQLILVADKLGLDGHDAGYLELACEEVFLYMHDEFQAKGFGGPLKFSFRGRDSVVNVEVAGGMRFASEADELAAGNLEGYELATDEELNALGLILLGRVASDVTHITIADYTYIRFTLFNNKSPSEESGL